MLLIATLIASTLSEYNKQPDHKNNKTLANKEGTSFLHRRLLFSLYTLLYLTCRQYLACNQSVIFKVKLAKLYSDTQIVESCIIIKLIWTIFAHNQN